MRCYGPPRPKPQKAQGTASQGDRSSSELRKLLELVVLPVLEVHKACEVILPEELGVADRAVALFGDDDFRLPLDPLPVLVVRRVILLTMDKHHNIGVLFDGPRFTEMIEPRSVVPRRLRLPVELGEAEHRDVELA